MSTQGKEEHRKGVSVLTTRCPGSVCGGWQFLSWPQQPIPTPREWKSRHSLATSVSLQRQATILLLQRFSTSDEVGYQDQEGKGQEEAKLPFLLLQWDLKGNWLFQAASGNPTAHLCKQGCIFMCKFLAPFARHDAINCSALKNSQRIEWPFSGNFFPTTFVVILSCFWTHCYWRLPLPNQAGWVLNFCLSLKPQKLMLI